MYDNRCDNLPADILPIGLVQTLVERHTDSVVDLIAELMLDEGEYDTGDGEGGEDAEEETVVGVVLESEPEVDGEADEKDA